jgi:hypothetical protein
MITTGFNTLAVSAFLFLAIRILLRFLTPKPVPGIPHYKPIGIFGDIPRMANYLRKNPRRKFNDFFAQAAVDLGPIAQVFLPNRPMIILSDHQEMEDILLRRWREFDHSTALHELYEGQFHTALGSQWTI